MVEKILSGHNVVAVIPAYNEERFIAKPDNSAGDVTNIDAGRLDVEASIIVPAYNEQEALPHVLSALTELNQNRNYEILVIDDGSTDRTAEVAAEYPCCVLIHEENKGKGAAMQTGIENAKGQKLIFIDGDATYPVDAIPQIVMQLDTHDLVRGKREITRANMPRINALGNKLFESAVSLVHQVDSSDVLTGLYGIRKSVIEKMRLQSNGFDIESEIVIKAGAMGIQTTTIPITYHERIGDKKLRPFQDGIRILTRVFTLATMYNPFAMYVIPGLVLWFFAIIAVFFLSQGPVITPFVGLSTHSFILSVMSLLAGFQLIMFGLVVNLYAAESGLGTPSRILSVIARKIPRRLGAFISFLLIFIGVIWSFSLAVQWWQTGFGDFLETEALIVSLASIIWGIQLMCTMFFFSLFASNSIIHLNGD